MASAVQGSLFDHGPSPQLGAGDEVSLGPLAGLVTRRLLSRGAWIDVLPSWVSGADRLLEFLTEQVPWRGERRQMYERVVDVPRLLCFYGEDEPLPHPVLDLARDALSAHYAAELGEPSGRRGCVCTGTVATPWPGTATPSDGAGPRTRWWPSSPWAARARCCSGPAEGA